MVATTEFTKDDQGGATARCRALTYLLVCS
jgi:hypothetical protein